MTIAPHWLLLLPRDCPATKVGRMGYMRLGYRLPVVYREREREREGEAGRGKYTHPIDLISFSYLLYCVLLTKTEYYLLYKLRSIKHKLIESYRLSLNVNKLY